MEAHNVDSKQLCTVAYTGSRHGGTTMSYEDHCNVALRVDLGTEHKIEVFLCLLYSFHLASPVLFGTGNAAGNQKEIVDVAVAGELTTLHSVYVPCVEAISLGTCCLFMLDYGWRLPIQVSMTQISS